MEEENQNIFRFCMSEGITTVFWSFKPDPLLMASPLSGDQFGQRNSSSEEAEGR